MRKTLVINSFSGTVQVLITVVLVLFTIPIFVHQLGTELFGVYSLLLLIGNLSSLANLGINASLIKFISEQGKSTESDYDIIVSLIILSTIIICLSTLALFFEKFIMTNVLAIKSEFINNETIGLYNYLILSNIIMFIGQIGTAILDALQKIYLTNLFQLIYSFLYWGLMLLALTLFSSLQYIGLSIILTSLIWFLLVFFSVKRFWRKLQFKGIKTNFYRVFKKNIGYGIKVYTSSILNFLFEPLSKILLSNFVGIKEVGLFDIVLRIKTQAWNILSKLLYPIIPHISKERIFSKIKYFITDLEQKIVFIILPLIILIVFGAYPFVKLWIGRDIELISVGIILLVPAHIAGLLLFPNYQFLMLKGYPGKTIILQAINSIVNVVCFFVLLPNYGYYAIILANFIAILSSTIVNMYYQKKYLGSFIFKNLQDLFKWIIIVITLSLVGIILTNIIKTNFSLIFVLVFMTFIVSILLFRILKVFSAEDINKYIGFNQRLLSIINKLLITN